MKRPVTNTVRGLPSWSSRWAFDRAVRQDGFEVAEVDIKRFNFSAPDGVKHRRYRRQFRPSGIA